MIETIINAIKDNHADAYSIRKAEEQAAELYFVKKELADMDIEPVDCGKAGVVALVGGKKPGKRGRSLCNLQTENCQT